MKRMMFAGLLAVLLVGWASSPASAQTATKQSNLISYVSFYAGPSTSVESAFTVIASLGSWFVDLYQLQLFTLDSLVSVKIRQASGYTGNGDKSFWFPLASMATTMVPSEGPFAKALQLVPGSMPLGPAAYQQPYMRLDSGSRLMMDSNGGPARIVGFARYRYVPQSDNR